MPRISNLKKSRLETIAKANVANPKKQDISLNEASMETQLELTGYSESDVTPDNLSHSDVSTGDQTQSDLTPDNLDSSKSTDNESIDPDFSAPANKLMMIPFSFILSLLNMVSCPVCKLQGGFGASVTDMNGFMNDINFLCRCKHSFGLKNFPSEDINAVLIRNLIVNGIPKQQFQRVLQIGNFGANVEGEDRNVNLSSPAMMKVYKEQNDAVIEGSEALQRAEMECLMRANKKVIISTDMTYAKRGYHSPAGHAALICDGVVIDARTAKRGSKKSANAYGDIVDMPANKLERYVIQNMLKDASLYLGPLIAEIHIDQDAALQTVIENMKWEEADTKRVNKWTGRIEVTRDMIGQSVWNGQIPVIHPDKVIFDRN